MRTKFNNISLAFHQNLLTLAASKMSVSGGKLVIMVKASSSTAHTCLEGTHQNLTNIPIIQIKTIFKPFKSSRMPIDFVYTFFPLLKLIELYRKQISMVAVIIIFEIIPPIWNPILFVIGKVALLFLTHSFIHSSAYTTNPFYLRL